MVRSEANVVAACTPVIAELVVERMGGVHGRGGASSPCVAATSAAPPRRRGALRVGQAASTARGRVWR